MRWAAELLAAKLKAEREREGETVLQVAQSDNLALSEAEASNSTKSAVHGCAEQSDFVQKDPEKLECEEQAIREHKRRHDALISYRACSEKQYVKMTEQYASALQQQAEALQQQAEGMQQYAHMMQQFAGMVNQTTGYYGVEEETLRNDVEDNAFKKTEV